MTQLDALLDNASNNTAGVFSLSGETLAVLFFALSQVQNLDVWRDYPDELLTDEQTDQIVELVDWANDELMREVSTMPAGATMMWHTATPPDDWLICNGQSVLKTEWPELYAVWGNKYGSTSTHFTLLDMRDRSPLGVGTWFNAVDTVGGAFNVTLTTNEMPAHTHDHIRAGGAAGGAYTNVAGASATNPVNVAWPTQSTGGGQPHANLHPVKAVHYIVYAGKRVAP